MTKAHYQFRQELILLVYCSSNLLNIDLKEGNKYIFIILIWVSTCPQFNVFSSWWWKVFAEPWWIAEGTASTLRASAAGSIPKRVVWVDSITLPVVECTCLTEPVISDEWRYNSLVIGCGARTMEWRITSICRPRTKSPDMLTWGEAVSQTHSIKVWIINCIATVVEVRSKCIWRALLVTDYSSTYAAVGHEVWGIKGRCTISRKDIARARSWACYDSHARWTLLTWVTHVQETNPHPCTTTTAATRIAHGTVHLNTSSITFSYPIPSSRCWAFIQHVLTRCGWVRLTFSQATYKTWHNVLVDLC